MMEEEYILLVKR